VNPSVLGSFPAMHQWFLGSAAAVDGAKFKQGYHTNGMGGLQQYLSFMLLRKKHLMLYLNAGLHQTISS